MDLNLSEKENIKFITTTKKYDFMGEKNGWQNVAEDIMLERISRVSLAKTKDGKNVAEKECPWLKDNKPYNEKFDVYVTKEHDISISSNIDLYEIIDLTLYGYIDTKDAKKIINDNFNNLINHLNNGGEE
jgi:hypothetical protein